VSSICLDNVSRPCERWWIRTVALAVNTNLAMTSVFTLPTSTFWLKLAGYFSSAMAFLSPCERAAIMSSERGCRGLLAKIQLRAELQQLVDEKSQVRIRRSLNWIPAWRRIVFFELSLARITRFSIKRTPQRHDARLGLPFRSKTQHLTGYIFSQ